MESFIDDIYKNVHLLQNYEKLEHYGKNDNQGFLYMFNCDKYNENPSVDLPENSFKFGCTSKELIERLNQYNASINMRNIFCINCTLSLKRERLIKMFLKNRTLFRPISGQEYFTNCFEEVKLLILIFASQEESYINSFYDAYDKKEIIYLDYLERVSDIFITLFGKIDYIEPKPIVNIPKKNISQPLMRNNLFVCDYCDKTVTTKRSLDAHKEVCVGKKFTSQIDEINQELQYKEQELEEKNSQIEKLENENKRLLKQTKKLEKKIEHLIFSHKNDLLKILENQNIKITKSLLKE